MPSHDYLNAASSFDSLLNTAKEVNNQILRAVSGFTDESVGEGPVLICVDDQNDLTYEDYYKVLCDSVTRYVTKDKVASFDQINCSDSSRETMSFRRKQNSLLAAIIHEAAHIYMSLLNNYELYECEIKAVNLLLNRTGAYGSEHNKYDDIKEWHTATQIIKGTSCQDVDLSYTEFKTVPAFTSIGPDTLVHLCAGDIMTKELGLGIKYSLKSDLLECRDLFIDYYERNAGMRFSDLLADERKEVLEQWKDCLEVCKVQVLEHKYGIIKLSAFMASDLCVNSITGSYAPKWAVTAKSVDAMWKEAYYCVPKLKARIQYDSKNKIDIEIRRK